MRYLFAATLLVLMLFAFAPAATAAAPSTAAPLVRPLQGASLNWSGYAVSIPDVTSATGTFTVPTVKGPGSVGGLPTDVSVWVGIDGYTSGTVEQTGVSGSYDSSTNTATYHAWWEMYPRVSTTIKTMSVSPGDSVTATVAYNGGASFTLSILDSTNGQSFSITAHAAAGGRDVAQRNSAEWVVERAATIDKGYLTILPLATFTPTAFSGENFVAGGTSYSLQDAVSGFAQYVGCTASTTSGCVGTPSPPSQPYWEQMYIVSISGTNLVSLDSTTSVSSNSFSVSFLDNGTPLPIQRI